ncbi:MAG: arylsulfatase [Verrucomicrobia bacterium]|nr:arylsulfatase [Verrucomicrobiota bacterium]
MNARVLLACLLSLSPLAGVEKPNILLIVADDLGWADVGWHGGFGKTPNLDRLVRTGLELDQHYVQPVCTPTRTALMSGRCPGRFGPQALSPSNLRAMPLGTTTLASALKSVGYRTHLAGKWHLGARPEWIPNAYGFDTSYGTLTGAADPWTHKYRKDSPYVDTWHRDGRLFHEEGNATELVAAEALKRITQGGDQPWFMYVPFHAVHSPVDAPAEYKKLYDGVRFHDDEVKHESRLRMAAMVAQLDAKVGAFLEALERTHQRENTLIIFTSENDPLRGQKNTLYEGGTRVCAFVNWPGKLKPAKVTAPLYVGDWLPTLGGLTGFAPATDLKWDGLDRWKVLTGEDAAPAPRSIYIAHPQGRSLRHGDWKIIAMNKAKAQLFNLAADPYEKEDLAGKEPQRLQEMRAKLAAEFAKDDKVMPADLKGLPH